MKQGAEKVDPGSARNRRIGFASEWSDESQRFMRASLFLSGSSLPIRGLLARIEKAAGSTAPVLLLGEKGSGRLAAAHLLHGLSNFSDGPFVHVSCDQLGRNGSNHPSKGGDGVVRRGSDMQLSAVFCEADGGSLFLDEVGDLSEEGQRTLVSCLRQSVDSDDRIRLIASTSENLERAARIGSFRKDIYLSLCVLTLTIPPLRQRDSDCLELASVFLRKYTAQDRTGPKVLSDEAAEVIRQFPWPGNIPELENCVRRAAILSEGCEIQVSHLELGSERMSTSSDGSSLRDVLLSLEKYLVLETLKKHKGNKSRAAAELKISRPTLYDLIRKLEINVNKLAG